MMATDRLAGPAVAAALGFAGLNLLGPDPGDLVIAAAAPLVLAARPGAVLLPRFDPVVRLLLAMFLAGYLLSLALNEFKWSFALNFGLNSTFFVLVYAVATSPTGPGLDVVKPLVLGFLASVTVAFLAGGTALPAALFDLARDNRFMGLLGDPNLLGLLACLTLLMLIDRFVTASPAMLARLLVLGGIAIAFAVLAATQSRSAWVAFAAGLLGYSILLLRASRRAVLQLLPLLAVVGLVVAAAATAWLSGYFEDARRAELQDGTASTAEGERFQFLYTLASISVGAQRAAGVGPGMTAEATGFTNLDGDPIGGHNAFVQVFTENGILSAAALVAILAVSSLRLLRLALRGESILGVSCRVVLCGCVSTAVVGMAHDLLSWRVAWIMPTLGIVAASLQSGLPRGVAVARLAVRVQ